MTKRKFYKTTFVYELLTEEPVDPYLDLNTIQEIAEVGEGSGDFKSRRKNNNGN